MPLTLLIESELDERSATAAANRAERVYADASRNISRSMSSQIGEGAQVAGKAVEKMADSARASYQKVLKAQDELAQQERQLKQMREEGARGVEVQAERVRQARRAEKDAIREAAGALNEYERSVQGVGESGMRAGAQLRQGLRQGIESGLADVTRGFGAMGGVADTAFAGISRSGGIAALGVAGVGLAARAVTQQLYALGSQWDAISDKISFRTGASDEVLSGITDSVKRVASDTAAPLEVIGDIGGQVAQSMKLAGPELDAMTQRLALLQEQGNPVGTRDLAKAFNVFGVEAKDQADTLDHLFNVSQSTGIPLQELVGTLTSAGRATKQFGLDAGQTAGLLATFERAGLSGDATTKALTIALKNFSNQGKEAGPALTEAIQRIQDLADAGRDSEASMLAASTFGGKSYLDMLNAIKDHRLNPDELSKPFDKLRDSIPEAADKTEDFAEHWQKLKNTFASGPLADAGSSIFDFLNGQMQQSTDLLKNFNTEVDKMIANGGLVGPKAPGSPDSTGLIPGGGGPGAQRDRRGGVDGDPALRDALGMTGNRAGIGGSLLSDWPVGKPYWGNAVKDATKSGSSGVAVPYGPGYGAAPRPGESSAMYQAEQNVLEAQHRRATAEAELQRVRADSTHTTNDEVKAENDLAQAKKGEIDANMRLHDTSVKAAESLNKATGQLSEFGSGIDADFGISKGLPGIADNLVRFLGSLALAGPMAQLNAISAANPNQGSGLMGILASQGVFGSQFTPQAIAAAGGSAGGLPTSAGASGATSVGAPLPGESPRDFAHRVMMPFWQSQGFQVGDHAADKAGEHQNGALDIMVPSIQAGQQVLQQVLSDPNVYGAIFNNQTYGYGHGAAPQDYKAGHTGDPSQDHTNHVHAWYKPGDPNDINPGGTPLVTAGGGLNSSGATPVFVVNMPGGSGGGTPFAGTPGAPGAPTAAGGLWDKVAQAESSGNWANADTGHNGHFGGLQFSPATWKAYGGQEFAPMPNQATRDQQIEIANRTAFKGYNGTKPQGLGAWEAITKGMVPGVNVNTPAAAFGSPGQGFPLPWALGGGPLSPAFDPAGPGSPFGPDVSSPMPGQIGPFAVPGAVGATGNAIGAGRSIVGAGRSAADQPQPSDPYGVAPATGPGGGGIGITPGGTVDTAIGIAASAANLFAPGAGAAAQAGIKLASRAIQYGGQVAGIAADGLMQTFLPAESQKAQSGWLQRGVGALASVKPALPNIAGGKAPQIGQGAQGQGQQPGQPPVQGGDTNITVNNQRATEDGTGKDIAFHLGAQNQGPGWL